MYKNKGITIVSLIIIIILLIILVVISIQSITNTGLFEGSSKVIQRIKIEEWLALKIREEDIIDDFETEEQKIETIRQNIIEHKDELEEIGMEVKIEEISTEENGEKVEEYFYVLVDKDIYKVSLMEYGLVGIRGKFLPILKFKSITETTNSIAVEVTTKRNEGGKIEYYIKAEDEDDYVLKETQIDGTNKYTYTGLEQNKNYNIKIVAIAENKQMAQILVDTSTKSVEM